MSAQPANTDILIYRTTRTVRDSRRHESVGALIKRLRPLTMVVPGAEVLVGVLSRDTTRSDFSSYMGQASWTAGRGFPIVVGLQPIMPFGTAQATLPNADFAFQVGSDWFITDVKASLATSDMFGDLLALDKGYTASN